MDKKEENYPKCSRDGEATQPGEPNRWQWKPFFGCAFVAVRQASLVTEVRGALWVTEPAEKSVGENEESSTD